jgi:hypothetical protein
MLNTKKGCELTLQSKQTNNDVGLSQHYRHRKTRTQQGEIIIKIKYRPNIEMSGLEQTAADFIELSHRDFILIRARNSQAFLCLYVLSFKHALSNGILKLPAVKFFKLLTSRILLFRVVRKMASLS